MPDDKVAKPAIVVSACLLGVRCNHEGEAARRDLRADLERHYRVVGVCPEVLGGLTTPRPPAEIQADGRVVNVEGEDVTAAYRRGAEQAVRIARASSAHRALLKARSPSCAPSQVYDGTFSGSLVAGQGVTCAALRAAGLEVSSEDDELPTPLLA